MSRRSLLVLSIVVSLTVHGLVLLLAPWIAILSPSSMRDELLQTFRVKLFEEEPPPIEDEAEPGNGRRLTSRPGTIQDLLDRELERIKPADSALNRTVEVPSLAERLVSENLEREHELETDPEAMAAVDTKIVEITDAEMREEIQIARRLVSPSTSRILDEGVLPTLRGEADDGRDKVLSIGSIGAGGGGAGDAGPGRGGEEGLPPPEPDILGPPEPERPPIELPPEQDVARRPIEDAIKKESRGFEFIDDLVDISLDTYVPAGEEQGYFRLRIAPKEGQTIEPLPKDITFVVDASNSILQRKLDKTVGAFAESIDRLRPQDRFNVVVFRGTATRFQPQRVFATPEHKSAAKKFLENIRSRGETDVYAGIRPEVEEPSREGVPGIVLVATDGRPTTGIRDGRTIINALTDDNRLRNSIFAYGGGGTVNRNLLDLLAYRNKGESRISPSIDSIREDLPDFVGRLDDPILVDCRADLGRVDEEGIFPRELPDFYRGQAVTVYGRFDPARDRVFAMRLTGKAADRRKEVVFQKDLSKAGSGDEEIARDWAFRKIYHLIGEIWRVGEEPELLSELRELSRKYNIRTSYDDG